MKLRSFMAASCPRLVNIHQKTKKRELMCMHTYKQTQTDPTDCSIPGKVVVTRKVDISEQVMGNLGAQQFIG